MAGKPKKHGDNWTKKDINQIGVQARRSVPTEKIAKNLKRTEAAVRSKATDEKISLKPKDKKK